MTVVVRMDDEHAAAIDVAIIALKAELAVVERWGGNTTAFVLLVDDLEELRERYRLAINPEPDPWSRKVPPRFEVVR